ncbi:MAG: hypothetical protein CSB16_00740 [Clostridiales bacterium]|nr:MAG: hypothetical protein CSB16_00740 [Clostridiales bacterium]
MNKISEYLKLIVGVLFILIPVAFLIKANFGLAAFDMYLLNTSQTTGIKYGTVNIITGIFLVIVQFFIVKKFEIKRFIQVLFITLPSLFFNFFFYTVLENFNPENLLFRIVLFVVMDILMALGIAILTRIKVVVFPLETTMVEAKKAFKVRIGIIKYVMDFIFISIGVSLFFIFDLENINVGIGTVVLVLTQGSLVMMWNKLIDATKFSQKNH